MPTSVKTRPPTRSTRNRPAPGSRQQIEAEITNRILKLLDQGQLLPWEPGWSNSRHGVPINLSSGKPYRGINHWMTLLGQKAMGHDAPRWLTWRQAASRNGHIRQGESGIPIVFWKPIARRPETGPAESDDANATPEVITLESPGSRRQSDTYSLLRSYRVFNVAQTEDCRIPPLPPEELRDYDPIATVQAIFAGMPGQPTIETYRLANHAPHCAPSEDTVRVPEPGHCEQVEDYYNTLFHELIHCTGHPKTAEPLRLGRQRPRPARLRPGGTGGGHGIGAAG